MTSSSTPPKSSQNNDKNLFTECVSFWGGSIAAPTSTNLRILARKGLLSDEADAQRVLTLPVTMKDMMEVFLKNKEPMLKEFAHDNGIPFHINTIDLYQKHFPNPEHAELVVFDDENREEEIVYGIIVNTATKRTMLTFRGSVSKRDYEADFDVEMRKFEIEEGEDIRVVRAQKGFTDYLFGTQAEKETVSMHGEGESFSKFHEILQSLLDQYEQYPDHELCITGHSLGG